jgi:NitT/TauT family transport system permease protein
MNRINQPAVKKAVIIIIWLAVWQLASMVTGLEILLPGPVRVFTTFFRLLLTREYYKTVIHSMLYIITGFAAAFAAGVVFGSLSGFFLLLKDFLEPVLLLMKSVPVAAIIILMLIWFGSSKTVVIISFMVVFPMIYNAAYEGIRAADNKMLELAAVYKLPPASRIRVIYFPAACPFFEASLKTSFGMCWKAGVSAEVIGLVKNSIGSQLYYSKLYLMTPELFAWSATIMLLSCIFEKIIIWLLAAAERKSLRIKKGMGRHTLMDVHSTKAVSVDKLAKSYDGTEVLREISCSFRAGRITCINGVSGVGKTTLLRILMKLEKPDSGTVSATENISVMFQENRLIEKMSAVENVMLVMHKKDAGKIAEQELSKLLPKECLYKPAADLSGGMKRRAALVRAFAADSSVVVLDEPFTGLDADSIKRAADYIKQSQNGRTVLVVTHSADVCEMLGADICLLTSDKAVATIV